MRGTLVTLVHDNLGAHALLCMVLGFNTKYPCRFCKITLENSKWATQVDNSMVRTSYTDDLLKYTATLNNNEFDYKETFGIKKDSALNHLNFFQPAQGTTVDPLHDLGEGVIPKDLKKVFSYMKHTMKIREDIIRMHVENHSFGVLDNKHKPANLDINRDNLGQSATQLITLLNNFPHIYGKYFRSDADLKYLRLVATLIKIVQIAFKHKLLQSDINEMNELVSDYLGKLVCLFNQPLSRKHHFLLHYPMVMKRLGPTAHMSTAPYESKHSYFTKLIKKTCVNKNVIKTIAIRHQFVQAIKIKNGLKHKLREGKKKELDKKEALTLKEKFNLTSAQIYKISWIQAVYKFAPTYFFRWKERVYEIKDVILNEDKYYLICTLWECIEDQLHCSTRLIHQQQTILMKFSDIKNQKTFNKIYSQKNNQYYVLR